MINRSLSFLIITITGLLPINNCIAQQQSLPDQVWVTIAEGYGGQNFDLREWKEARKQIQQQLYSTQQEEYSAIEQLISRLDDTAVRFLLPQQAEALMDDIQGDSVSGIGLWEVLSVDIDERTGRLTVVTPVAAAPAAKAGLRPGDVIVEIGGLTTNGLTLEEAMALIRSPKNGSVDLTVKRNGEHQEFSIPFSSVTETVRVLRTFTDRLSNEKVGYIGLYGFPRGIAQKVSQAIMEFKRDGVDKLVLDMRNNPGGSVAEAVEIADFFLQPEVEIASIIRHKNTVLNTMRSTKAPLWNDKVIVLVNPGSASAAEMVAGALQAAGRAEVVGSKTFGKGLVHTANSFPDGTVLMIPVGRLYTPNERDILAESIMPDIQVQSQSFPVLAADVRSIGAEDDIVYQHAIHRL